jgi:hypothetical protein
MKIKLCLVLHDYVSKKGSLEKLNNDTIIHILSFIAGNEIYDLKAKAPAAELEGVTLFVEAHAKKRRDKLPKLLAYFESKKSAATLDTNSEAKKPDDNSQLNHKSIIQLKS